VTGEQLLEISNTLSALKRERFGKGPDQSRAYINDDLLVVAMKGGITPAERTLIDAGEEGVVRDMRLRFQGLMTDAFCGLVTRVTGRPVLSYHSQILFHPEIVVELFVLGDEV